MSSSELNQDRPEQRVRTAPNKTTTTIIIFVAIIGAIFGTFSQAARTVRQEYFLSNEIILMGTDIELETLIDELERGNSSIELTLVPERTFEFNDFSDNSNIGQITRSLTTAKLPAGNGFSTCSDLENYLEDKEIRLYELTGSTNDVEAVLEAIEQTDAGNNVLAEVNWVIGAPWSPTGSPWSPTGSPWSPTGSDIDQSKPTPATEEDFWAQKGFEIIGLADAQAKHDMVGTHTVRVGVFDTSPFEANTIQTQIVPSHPDNLNIEFHHPPFINLPATPKPRSREDIQVSNHGYFGASLIRALTPSSEIHLYRVLTENNRGDLATLNYQLLTFMQIANKDGADAIVNMSLGVPPLEPFRPFAPLLNWEFPLPFELERELESFEIVAHIAECLDVVMVAAAGNDSYESLKVSNYPGNWGTVLSVTASNHENEQSCFANNGDVAAPGGDGGPGVVKIRPYFLNIEKPIACEPKLDQCNTPDCQYSVIGYVHSDTIGPDDTFATHHHWVGTSFSTPLVSGLAALLRNLDSTMSASAVREAILCGTITPTTPQDVRVINVEQTLVCAGLK